jgi:hypothetical protein
VIAATTFASDNWVTEQTVAERGNLAALDAWIEPPPPLHGFDAAVQVEHISVGPLPPPTTEQEVAKLVDAFNAARRSEDDKGMADAIAEQTVLYRDLSAPAWDLTWRVVERERRWPEEPRFVQRRWDADIDAYSRHMEWMDGPSGGRRRTRQTVPQAIRTRDQAEEAKSLLEAEQALSDPIRIIPYLLDHRAIEGTVTSYDDSNREIKPGNQRASKVPVLVLRTPRPCLLPVGKELWWTDRPDRVRAVVHSVAADPDGTGSLVELKVMQNIEDARALGSVTRPVCFSQLTTKTHWAGVLPDHIPWTHRIVEDEADGASLEEAG